MIDISKISEKDISGYQFEVHSRTARRGRLRPGPGLSRRRRRPHGCAGQGGVSPSASYCSSSPGPWGSTWIRSVPGALDDAGGRRAGEITDSNVSARVFELKCLPLRMDAGFRCAMVNLSLLDNMVRLIIAWYNMFNNWLFRFRKSSGSGCQARKRLQDMVRTWDTPT